MSSKSRFILAPLATTIYGWYRRLRRRDLLNSTASIIKNLAEVGLDQATVDDLPRWGYYAGGRPMEWMNLVMIGTESQLRVALEAAGWYEADPVTPWVLLKALAAIITNRQYLHGPFTPIYVGDQPQRLSYQKPTELNQFRQRHHARFWPTDHCDAHGQPVWIAHASYDIGIKGAGRFKFPPVHEISGDIDAERLVITDDLVRAGAKLRGYVQLQPAGGGTNAYGDDFTSDGRAAIIDVGAINPKETN